MLIPSPQSLPHSSVSLSSEHLPPSELTLLVHAINCLVSLCPQNISLMNAGILSYLVMCPQSPAPSRCSINICWLTTWALKGQGGSNWHLDSMCSDAQSCPTLWDPMDCSLLGSSVYGILQGRILEWVAMPFSRESFWPRDRTEPRVPPALAGRFFTTSAAWAESWCTRYKCLNGLFFNV